MIFENEVFNDPDAHEFNPDGQEVNPDGVEANPDDQEVNPYGNNFHPDGHEFQTEDMIDPDATVEGEQQQSIINTVTPDAHVGGSNSRIPQTLAFMEIILIQGEHLLQEMLFHQLELGPGITLLIL